MFTFFIILYYNYNGDNMKDSQSIMMNITNMEDIKKLQKNSTVKYINLDIENPNLEVIYYLIEHGQNYSYAEQLEDKKGYIYVSYDMFKQAELFILELINKVNIKLGELEIARYLYIAIGKNVGYDINILPDKNETFNLQKISSINNLWGSVYYGKGTNNSLTKLYLYLCNFMNIDCKLITTSSLGYQKNILNLQNRKIVVDITQDIPYIQSNFKTKNFLGYDDNLSLDRKIGYIEDEYNDTKIEKELKNINYDEEKIIPTILTKTSNILNIQNIKPIELGMIYENIFAKYCPNTDVKIYNLYMNVYPEKEHFIIISNNDKYYSFNYAKNAFVEIDKQEIIEKVEEKAIGIYLNEKLPFISNNESKILS